MRFLMLSLACGLLGGSPALAYTQATVAAQPQARAMPVADTGTRFDVASIRLTASSERDRTHIWSSPADGSFRAQNVSIDDLLEFAYAMPDSRFVASSEARGLLRSPRSTSPLYRSAALDERLAGLPTAIAKQQKQQLIQALLADRFNLKTQAETRSLPIYTLVAAKDGPKFTASKASGTRYDMGRGSLRIEGGDDTVEIFADNLAAVLGRPVVNGTGIKGRYLMTLRWMPDDSSAPPPGTEALPSIFTALQEQLGLKLEAGKGPVSVLVVDSVQMPSAN
jgi:uncharacterized protein (TIGR03435 family)